MIAVLSGGTGTPKLLQGLVRVVPEEELAVIVNTAEDEWLAHGYLSPDVDSVVYTLAGLVDEETWHGRRGDTHRVHEELQRLGADEYMRIGDLDRALHIWRGEQMKAGKPLSEITKEHCKKLGIKTTVLPMSDDRVETVIDTPGGEMSLHEFWVKNRGKPMVKSVHIKGLNKAKACDEAVAVLEEADRIIIGPSNPVTSISPILGFQEVDRVLRKRRNRVLAVSPIIGGSAFSGPAEKLMKAFGIKVSAPGIAEFYNFVISSLVVDSSEATEDVVDDVRILRADILLDSIEKREALGWFIMESGI